MAFFCAATRARHKSTVPVQSDRNITKRRWLERNEQFAVPLPGITRARKHRYIPNMSIVWRSRARIYIWFWWARTQMRHCSDDRTIRMANGWCSWCACVFVCVSGLMGRLPGGESRRTQSMCLFIPVHRPHGMLYILYYTFNCKEDFVGFIKWVRRLCVCMFLCASKCKWFLSVSNWVRGMVEFSVVAIGARDVHLFRLQ